jgi:soluble lytic murein transglycosylase-like protein
VSPKQPARLVLAAVAFVGTFAGTTRADVYFYKDTAGVYHFSSVRVPGSQPFHPVKPFDRPGKVTVAPAVLSAKDTGAFDEIIGEFSQKYGVEPALVKAVIRAESGFNRFAVSRKGARGLMQLMPKTARMHGVRNVYDARENIRGGVQHLKMLLGRHRQNLPHVLAAYNAGSDPVQRYRGIPPYRETRDYVARVLRFRQQYLRDARLQLARQ